MYSDFFQQNKSSITKQLFLTSVSTFSLLIVCTCFYAEHFFSKSADISVIFQKTIVLAWYILLFSLFQLILCIGFIKHKKQIKTLKQVYKYTYLILLGFLISICILDLKLFGVMGNHIYDPYILQSLGNTGINKEIHFGTSTIMSLIIFIEIAFASPFIIYKFIKRINLKTSFKRIILCSLILPVSSIILIVFNLPVLSGMNTTLPFIEEIGLFSSIYVDTKLDVNALQAQSKNKQYKTFTCTKTDSIKTPNILFIVVESLRSDIITNELTPTLKALNDTLSTIQSKSHFSGSHVTEKGVFSLLFGLHSFNYNNFANQSISSVAIKQLKANNYTVDGVSASGLSDWHGSGFMMQQFNSYKQFTDGPPNNDDQLVVNYLKSTYSSQSTTAPHCQFVFLNSTHHNYYFPSAFEFYKPIMPTDYNHFLGDDKLEKDKNKIFNRYKNSVRYVDYIIKQIIELYKQDIIEKKLILVITGDHAEEFWDKGFLGHGAANLYNCRTQVPLIFYLPNTQAKKVLFTSHTEVMPSIINFISATQYQKLKPYFNGTSLLDSTNNNTHNILICASSFEKNHILCFINNTGKYWLKADITDPYIKITKHLSMMDDEVKLKKIDTRTSTQIIQVFKTLFEF